MHRMRGFHAVCFLFVCFCTACAPVNPRTVASTPIYRAQAEIPEQELMDVGLSIFESSDISDRTARKQGTNPDVRQAECYYVPYHLKNTLEQSGHWGMVRVLPEGSDSADVFIEGEIIESNGEHLELRITVSDATGAEWFEKKYKATVTGEAYKNNVPGEKDPFQGIYNAIANDVADHRKKLEPADIIAVRTSAKLRFAQDFSPDAFAGYLVQDSRGSYTLNRLPADDDPMMARVMSIRERDHMFVDTLNEYYETFYHEMWPPYEEWRELNRTERSALAEQEQKALFRKIGGALLVALAVGLELSDTVDSNILTGGLIIAGGQVFMSGMNISKQAEMHYEALAELGESFGGEMEPVVVELEGNNYELTGSAEEQYRRWRELLRKIYYAETGFVPEEGTSP